jgi:hypothetical protein
MLIVSTFEHSLEVEQALAVLEKTGIDRDSILVVPMDPYHEDPNKLTLRAVDIQARAFEVGMAVATASCVIGSSVGFILHWGPIAWGLISAVVGFAIGFGAVCWAKMLRGERAIACSPRRPVPEIAVIIQCCETKSAAVHDVLWQYRAISVGESTEPASS